MTVARQPIASPTPGHRPHAARRPQQRRPGPLIATLVGALAGAIAGVGLGVLAPSVGPPTAVEPMRADDTSRPIAPAVSAGPPPVASVLVPVRGVDQRLASAYAERQP
jgi:hypothetical protein